MPVLSKIQYFLLMCCFILLPACASNPSSLSALPDLRGQWVGEYPCCGVETIEITQKGHRVQAIKVTGDDFVPTGEVTWRASVENGEGEGQIAEAGFTNPRFVTGYLTVLDNNTIQFAWGDMLTVIYSRLD